MVALGVVALSFWPDFSAVEAATTVSGDADTRDEFRSQMIMPLSLGSDSGRHMGATRAVVSIANAPERATIRMVATLGQGDSFARMLQRAGVGSADAALWGFLAFYLSCIAVTWFYYTRRGSILNPGQPTGRPLTV